jgi:hypothetical protein
MSEVIVTLPICLRHSLLWFRLISGLISSAAAAAVTLDVMALDLASLASGTLLQLNTNVTEAMRVGCKQ